jgi:predicted alpha-1,6-mannanase (GH76 family)
MGIRNVVFALSAFSIPLLADPDRAYEAFNAKYWNATGKYYHKLDNRTGRLDYWMTAHAWEMSMDVYARTRTAASLQRVKDIYDGFVAYHGTDWTTNDYNDDIMWWVLAATRAFELTGETRYRDQAKTHFDWIWSTQTDNVFGGGIWWKNTERLSKNSCIVQPAIIAAVNLSRILNDAGYRTKAQTLYTWQKTNLVQTSGMVRARSCRARRVGRAAPDGD